MTDLGLSIAAAGLLVAGVVKGATGIGYTTCALPFLAVGLGFGNAMAIVLVPAVASNVATMWRIGQMGPTLRRFWPFYVGIVPGIGVGTAILATIDIAVAAQCLGLLTLAYVGLAWLKPTLSLPSHLHRPLAFPTGFLNGVMTGLTGSQVMPLMPYFMSLRLERGDQIQAINLAVTLASGVLALALARSGVLTFELAAISLIGAVPALIGVTIGVRLAQQLSATSFRQFSLATLAILALPLLVRVDTRPSTDGDPAAHAAANPPPPLSQP